ncbi:TOX high mobility group box family member 4 isoform X1 [Seriola lalandi dorsalis]|uniref:TOX high mobility group box family member 4 b n=1 Tax=Seriola lalandi dorsalis TaxID=1841481 RepID=A0A3B4X2R1_SERLL|nr:TOX high mobility group box family member 4 isoform X1 [Seriola lalandi dorsalis]XP_056225561.1 TOX high mobility group box family member 4b isoform X1 [Seriola aureovittata]
MDLNFYSDLTDGTGQHDGDPEFLDPQSFNGFDSDNKFPGGSDNYLTISGSGHPFLSSSECATKPIDLFNLAGSAGGTFHTPSLGDEEFEIPPISLDPDSTLTVSDVVSHFGELSDTGPSDSVVVPGSAVVEGDDPSFASTFVNAPSQGLEHLSLGVMNQSGGSTLLGSSLGMDLGHPIGSQFSSSSPVTIDVPLGDMSQGLLGSNQLTTIDQSELSAQLGLGLGGGNILQRPQSPEHPLSATASPTSSLQDDDMDDFRRSVLVESPVSLAVSPGVISLDPSLSDSPLSAPTSSVSPAVGRKGGAGGGKKGKKKKDPNEPQKPVSAYALFFRDTQAAIKGQNPNATFGEVSKIVASMWDSLGEEQKQVYKRKNEAAKKDYLKALAEYRASQISQAPIEVMDTSPSPPPPAPAPAITATPSPSTSATRATRSQHYNPEENTITNICTSNIILDLPQVTTRSRTGAIKPQPPPAATAPNPPTVTKIIIKQTQLPSGGVSVTATPASSSRQPPPLQQMQSTPPPPRLQQMVHAQAPPPLQAKPRGGGAAAATAPPPLQIKVVPSSRQSDSSTPIIVTSSGETPTSGSSSSALTVEVGQSAAVVTGGEEVAEAEEGMEVEVTVAPGPSVTPASSPNICVRAGCTNPAVESKDWDKEYCSNECVATHCRDVFMAWCAIRGQNSTTVT